MIKTIKQTLIWLLTALLALAAVCLTVNPAKQTKADETYSETWVIKEKWTCTKDIDVNIGLKINGNISADRIVIQATNTTAKGVLYALGNEALKPLTQLYNDGNYMYFRSDGEISAFSYSEWKDTFGKIIFCADTSAAEYAELRAWLNENASLYVKVNTITFMRDGAVKFTATAETGKTLDLGGAGITSIMTKDGYTLKGYATAENGEIVYEADAVITPESDMTLYAVYEENKTPGDDETDKTGEQDKQNKKAVNVTGILVSIPLLALLAAGTVYIVGKIKKS